MTNYKENHYVPQWYQRLFLPATGEQKFHYLDLRPDAFVDGKGTVRHRKALLRWGTDRCFRQTDLYTTRYGAFESTEIERFFFGPVDTNGRKGIEYFANFTHPSADGDAFQWLLQYMSIQKLRTPKGLAHLTEMTNVEDKNNALMAMQYFQNLYCAIWTESVWALADATNTETKFIISDHPVTVYNQCCFPGSPRCRDFRDPDIWQLGTHTIFPLSPCRAIVLTNLAWVRNPYQNGKKNRPNANPMRTAMFNFLHIQTGRELSEVEVNQINYIIKKRAYRYIAAAKEEWLYPEKKIPTEHWSKLNAGYFLMPDPRSVTFSAEIVIGYKDGSGAAFDEYGRRPWQKGYKDEDRSKQEWQSFHRFQGEFARLMGPKRRGVCYEAGRLGEPEDEPWFHQYHLDMEKEFSPHAK